MFFLFQEVIKNVVNVFALFILCYCAHLLLNRTCTDRLCIQDIQQKAQYHSLNVETTETLFRIVVINSYSFRLIEQFLCKYNGCYRKKEWPRFVHMNYCLVLILFSQYNTYNTYNITCTWYVKTKPTLPRCRLQISLCLELLCHAMMM